MAAKAALIGALAAALCSAGAGPAGARSLLDGNTTMDANATMEMDMNATMEMDMNASAGLNETESEEGRRLFGLRKLLDMNATLDSMDMGMNATDMGSMDMGNTSTFANVTEGESTDAMAEQESTEESTEEKDDGGDTDTEDEDTDTEDEDTDSEDEN